MDETVYIETSIVGYLTARSTQNLILAANMEITKEWWNYRRRSFSLFTSEATLTEVAQGDTELAAQRLEVLRHYPLLALNQSVQDLAREFLSRSNLPSKAKVDAIHIAAATVHGMDYLLTWNCKHIANAQIQKKLAEISLSFSYVLPVLCTPNELMGG